MSAPAPLFEAPRETANARVLDFGVEAIALKAEHGDGGRVRVVKFGKAEEEVGAWVVLRVDGPQPHRLEALAFVTPGLGLGLGFGLASPTGSPGLGTACRVFRERQEGRAHLGA